MHDSSRQEAVTQYVVASNGTLHAHITANGFQIFSAENHPRQVAGRLTCTPMHRPVLPPGTARQLLGQVPWIPHL